MFTKGLRKTSHSLSEWACGSVGKLWANGGVHIFVQQHEKNSSGVSCSQAVLEEMRIKVCLGACRNLLIIKPSQIFPCRFCNQAIAIS